MPNSIGETNVGGGYGSTGTTLYANGNISSDGAIVAASFSGAAMATDTIWDAKGDIVAATAANTAARVAVGTDGQSLNADSGAASGVSYANRIRGALNATDNQLVRSDGTGTLTVQGTGIACDDSNNVSGMGTLGCGAITSSAGISGTTGTFSGNVTVNTSSSASLTCGASTTTTFSYLRARAADNAYSGLVLDSATDSRWAFRRAPTTNNLTIERYTGSSSFQDSPITIANSDGVTTLSKTVLFTGVRAVSATGGATAQEMAHGTYTPTLAGTLNVDATTAYVCHTTRLGNEVTVTGRLAVDPTATGTTTLTITLPVASAMTATDDLAGQGQANTVAPTLQPTIYADFTNDLAIFYFNAGATTNQVYYFNFTYTVK